MSSEKLQELLLLMRIQHKFQYEHSNKISVLSAFLLLSKAASLHPLFQNSVTFRQSFNCFVVVATCNERVEAKFKPIPYMLNLTCQQLLLLALNNIFLFAVVHYKQVINVFSELFMHSGL
jgi:hypothetical protein